MTPIPSLSYPGSYKGFIARQNWRYVYLINFYILIKNIVKNFFVQLRRIFLLLSLAHML